MPKALRNIVVAIIVVAFFVVVSLQGASAFSATEKTSDTTKNVTQIAADAKVRSINPEMRLLIQNVDITRFPEVSLIVEAINLDGTPVDSMAIRDLTVQENGQVKKVLSIRKISVKERIPVDFVFLIDVTGTMQSFINGTRNNIEKFVESLVRRGIDYRLGLVMFSDLVEKVYQPTEDVLKFKSWVTGVWASGGLDEPENALEALVDASKMQFRPSANKVVVLVTDAPYHQLGQKGNGRTIQTTESIIELLRAKQVRTFCIVPPQLKEYQTIAENTRGAVFDIREPFSKILDAYSTQLTNLFAITYRTDEAAIPDSLRVGLLDNQKRELVKRTIHVVELGRKLIIENLLFSTGSASIPDTVAELEILREFMANKPKVKIRVEGHTDSKGRPRLNMMLSAMRAESVKRYLVKKGIGPNRIETAGLGDTRPIGDNSTDFGRKLNRRTEVIIIAK